MLNNCLFFYFLLGGATMVGFSVRKMPLRVIDDNIAWLGRMIDHGDNRRHPRKKVKLRGRYYTQDLKGQWVPDQQFQNQLAGVVDMSVSGAGVVSSRPMSMGQRFFLVCDSGADKLKLDLQVVRNGRIKTLFHYGCSMVTCERVS
jgi:hypothetical protein